MEENSSKAIFNNLVTELKARLKAIPISGNEASKSQYVCSYLVTRVNLYEGKFELRPEKNITGPNGHGPVDFAIDLLQTAKTVSVTEVKDEDFFKGIAQNAVQLESALSNCKRKANEMEEESVFVGKVFGIITDAEKWYFMECSLDDQDRLRVVGLDVGGASTTHLRVYDPSQYLLPPYGGSGIPYICHHLSITSVI
ncbi:Coronin-like protein crn1 [Rhizophagus irregularis]|uniref:Coronin-like protein crn1 n=1 Tax=Rhizophagus irregularis TaxID=588596 RepID=UPI003320C02A|nr:Coronin-like protein crn1 [Rhizophagus irregularis]